MDVEGYLRRLRLSHPVAPSLEALLALHRAHVTLVPYETVEIQLGRPTTIDPDESVARIVAGRGGYCYHLNGAFSALLAALGFEVTRHVGGVFRAAAQAPGANANHLALTVRVDGQDWFVDAGLGDALFEPVPLREGAYTQGPFVYRLEPSPIVPGGWRFWHSPHARSFAGMDFSATPARMADFAAQHATLSTSPLSGFVRVAQVGRRTAGGVDFLRGTTLRRIDADGVRERVLETADEWFGVVDDVFGMPLHDVGADRRVALWDRLRAAHRDYLASITGPADAPA
jgi:arylamine N-acetyltransferase